MTDTLTERELYGAYYYEHYEGGRYERSETWLEWFGSLADAIVQDIKPKSVLDVGCAMGLLVEALRDRGVDARGIDISEYAIEQVRDDMKPYCSVVSVLDLRDGRFDLVTCIEMLEHLDRRDSERAVASLCNVADDILFSSTPDDYREDTHLNVQPPEYWSRLFAKHGFLHDLDFDFPKIPWAMRFRRQEEPLHRAIVPYERRLWALTRETKALREQALQRAEELERQEQALQSRVDADPRVSELERTAAEQTVHLDALNEQLRFMSDQQAERVGTVAELQGTLAERDGAVAELQGTLAERDGTVAELERTLAEQTVHLDALGEQLRVTSHQQTELRTMLRATHERLLDAQEQLAARPAPESQTRIADLEESLRLARQHADNLEAALAHTQRRGEVLEEELRLTHQHATNLEAYRERAEALETELGRMREHATTLEGDRERAEALETELGRMLEHAATLERDRERAEALETELGLSRQHAETFEANLRTCQEFLQAGNERIADLEARLARVRNSLPGRIYRWLFGGSS